MVAYKTNIICPRPLMYVLQLDIIFDMNKSLPVQLMALYIFNRIENNSLLTN